MMAVTKAGPTSDLFTSVYQRLVRTAKHVSITANEELTTFQNKTIKLMVDGLRDLIVAYNKLINGAPRLFQQNFGLVKIDVVLYSRQVCDELAGYTERTDIITYLNNKLTELRNAFIKAHHANEVKQKLPEFQSTKHTKPLEEEFSGIEIIVKQQ